MPRVRSNKNKSRSRAGTKASRIKARGKSSRNLAKVRLARHNKHIKAPGQKTSESMPSLPFVMVRCYWRKDRVNGGSQLWTVFRCAKKGCRYEVTSKYKVLGR